MAKIWVQWLGCTQLESCEALPPSCAGPIYIRDTNFSITPPTDGITAPIHQQYQSADEKSHMPSLKSCQWLRITNDDLMTSFKMADEISRAIAVFQALIFSLLNNLLIKRWGQNLVKYPIASTSILPATAMISISDSSVYQAGAQWYSAP